MSYARDRAHAKYCTAKHCVLETNGPLKIEQPCRLLDHILDMVEDDRAHAEAVALRGRGEDMRRNGKPDGTATMGYVIGAGLVVEAFAMDPYEQRDGQLVRKSDGKPVTP